MKEQKSKNKRNFIILVLVLIAMLVIVLLINILLVLSKPVYEEEILVFFSVGDNPGITNSDEALDFGVLLPGSAITRFVKLENQYSYPIEIQILISPELDGFIFGQKKVTLEPNEEIDYSISLKLPKDIEYVNVTGSVRFEGHKLKE